MIFIASFVFVCYSILILYFTSGIDKLHEEENKGKPENDFSILVPFRNEAESLPKLLESFAQLDYPNDLLQFILINDASSDASEEIVLAFKNKYPELDILLIENEKNSLSPKKTALSKGISLASKPWIITTDADCQVPSTWLRIFDEKIQREDLLMIAAPVAYKKGEGFLHNFQVLDFLSLQGITMGSFGRKDDGIIQPFLCNGANLCYKKEHFKEVNGFEGNEHIASGDDVFLMEKFMQENPDKVGFIKSKDVIVRTSSKDSWKELLWQRVRWSAKTTAFSSVIPKLIGIVVFMTNLLIIAMISMGISGHMNWGQVGIFFLVKFNIDFVFLHKSSKLFEEQGAMKSYFTSSVIYPVYTVLIVTLSLGKSYSWKGRKLK